MKSIMKGNGKDSPCQDTEFT